MEIGGYFGLELTGGSKKFHHTPFRLQSGRAALAFIFDFVKPAHVYVPFYTCNALLEPLIKANIGYSFYHLNADLELLHLPKLKKNELIIYVNYYDIKRDYAEKLSGHYKEQLIVDCTQSYFLNGNGHSWYFNSCRKFFGVPDGADLYAPVNYNLLARYNLLHANENYVTEHLLSRFSGNTQAGSEYFTRNEVLNGEGIFKISRLSACLLSNINYNKACEARQRNFRFLHQHLGATNLIKIADPFTPAPSFYPYLPNTFFDKKQFWDQKLFIPAFWNDCQHRQDSNLFETEVHISKHIIPIPADHRYKPSDFGSLLNILLH
jgi:hypothetical protein